MKKSLVFLSILSAATFSLTACGSAASPSNNTADSSKQSSSTFPVTLKDDAGSTVTLSKQPVKIASVTEGTDEILSALVPKDHIVLVTATSSDPTYSNVVDFAKGLPSIQQANAEQIIASKPDLALLASYTKQGVVTQVKQAGIPTYEFGVFNSITDIEKNIKVVGQLVGSTDGADKVVADMETKISSLKAKAQGHQPISVLDYSSYGYAAGNNTIANDIITDAGAKNAAESLNGFAQVSKEQIVKLNPDVIIGGSDDQGFVQKILSDPALQNVSAVKNKKVFAIKSADLESVSQYVTNAIADLQSVLYQ